MAAFHFLRHCFLHAITESFLDAFSPIFSERADYNIAARWLRLYGLDAF